MRFVIIPRETGSHRQFNHPADVSRTLPWFSFTVLGWIVSYWSLREDNLNRLQEVSRSQEGLTLLSPHLSSSFHGFSSSQVPGFETAESFWAYLPISCRPRPPEFPSLIRWLPLSLPTGSCFLLSDPSYLLTSSLPLASVLPKTRAPSILCKILKTSTKGSSTTCLTFLLMFLGQLAWALKYPDIWV